jgi:hypothetical protein
MQFDFSSTKVKLRESKTIVGSNIIKSKEDDFSKSLVHNKLNKND